jgi:hypothetical protein
MIPDQSAAVPGDRVVLRSAGAEKEVCKEVGLLIAVVVDEALVATRGAPDQCAALA